MLLRCQTLVAYVQDDDDIVKCIKFVKEHNLDVEVACGRHSYHGASSSTGIVIGNTKTMSLPRCGVC